MVKLSRNLIISHTQKMIKIFIKNGMNTLLPIEHDYLLTRHMTPTYLLLPFARCHKRHLCNPYAPFREYDNRRYNSTSAGMILIEDSDNKTFLYPAKECRKVTGHGQPFSDVAHQTSDISSWASYPHYSARMKEENLREKRPRVIRQWLRLGWGETRPPQRCKILHES